MAGGVVTHRLNELAMIAARERAGATSLRLDAAAFAAVLFAGLASLPTPFGGDQALNLLMGRVIAQGGAPYRDLWDLKHPGVFLFTAAGGSLFGFDEIGIHLFELLWMVLLALLVRAVAADWLRGSPAAPLAPLLTVVLYYALAGDRYLTQAESLVGLPLLASLWCTVEAFGRRRHVRAWLVASGAAAGIAAVFKMPYVAIPVSFWLIAAREAELRGEAARSRAWRDFVPWLLTGLAVPIAAAGVYLASKGVAGVFAWTAFRHPAEAIAAVGIEPRRLLRAVRSVALQFAPALLLAIAGVWDALRTRMDVVTAALCAWIGVGLALIAVQVISWWDYHFLVLLVPVGLLATRGIDAAARWVRGRFSARHVRAGQIALAIVLLGLFARPLTAITREASRVWASGPVPLSRSALDGYYAAQFPAYAAIRTRTAFLRRSDSHPGPIYVIDTPVYYVDADRRPAVPLLAPWFHPTDRLWRQFTIGLTRAHPPYVRIARWATLALVEYRPAIENDVTDLVRTVEHRYDVLARDDDGAWYIRRDLAAIDRSPKRR